MTLAHPCDQVVPPPSDQMQISDLNEWGLLQIVQGRLKDATCDAIQALTASPSDELDTDTFLSFIQSELDSLAITIPAHRNVGPQVIADFRAQTTRLFSSLEKVLITAPSQSIQETAKWWEIIQSEHLEGAEGTGSPALLKLQPFKYNEAWENVLLGLETFNRRMEKLLSIAERPLLTRPEFNPRRIERVEGLLNTLREQTSACSSNHDHQMLLEISTRIWREPLQTSTPTHLFLTSCLGENSWQEVECLHSGCVSCFLSCSFHLSLKDIGRNSEPFALSDPGLEHVPEVCRSISKCQHYNNTLRLIIKQAQLYTGKYDGTRISRQMAVPGHTIEHLLDNDILAPPLPTSLPSASVFRIQDKRELTLYLAWGFFDLFGFDWTEGSWSSDKIFLLSSSDPSSTPVLVGKTPFISCQRKSTTTVRPLNSSTEPLLDHSPFLSLGKLLVEIHIGRSVVVTEQNRQGKPSLWLTIAKIIEDDQLWSANREYIDAIESCLALHRSLYDHPKHASTSHDSAMQIYSGIVAKLEQDLSRYRKRKRNERPSDTPYFKSKSPGAPVHSPLRALHESSGQLLPEPTVEGGFYNASKRMRNADMEVLGYSHKQQPDFTVPSNSEQHCGGTSHSIHPRSKAANKSGRVSISTGGDSCSPEPEPTVPKPSCRAEFEIAIICALGSEYAAVEEIVDEFWDDQGDIYGKAPEDRNNYSTGRIGRHDVVLLSLTERGKIEASRAAADMRLSYTGVKLALFVGVCGAVPQYTHGMGIREILLGDVIVGHTSFPYDFGRLYGDRFRPKTVEIGSLARSRKEIRALTNIYEQRRTKGILENRLGQILKDVQASVAKKGYPGEYDCPGIDEDKLFKPDYRHRHLDRSDCECSGSSRDIDLVCDGAIKATCAELQCDEREMVVRKRKRLPDTMPMLHVGSIASGDWVMKSGTKRDEVAKSHGVISFEMEGAGIWDELPCLVVKGVADYADSHKSKDWQRYAAATAACATKAILERYIRSNPRP